MFLQVDQQGTVLTSHVHPHWPETLICGVFETQIECPSVCPTRE